MNAMATDLYTMNHDQLPSSRYSNAKVRNSQNVAISESFPDEMVSSRNTALVEPCSIIEEDPFQSPYSVMIGRSKACRESVGNKRLEVFAKMILTQYENASSRVEKSMLVTGLVDKVKTAGGTFVKVIDGDWHEANNLDAREKVGCVLRNLLSDKYRSSCKNKVAARRRRSSASQELDLQSTTSVNSSSDDIIMDSSSELGPDEVNSDSIAPESIVSGNRHLDIDQGCPVSEFDTMNNGEC